MNNSRLSIFFLFSLLAVALPFLCGCSRTNTAEAAGRTVVRFWNGFTGPDGKTMERMVAEFQRENPDVRVDMQVIPWAQYYDKLTLGLAFNDAPDLFICQAHRLPEFAHYRAFRALDDLVAGPDGLPRTDFATAAWSAGQIEGHTYGIPLDCYPLGLYYNKAHFRKAGIVDSSGEPVPPANWDQFVADARKLTIDKNGDGRPDQWGFSITNRYTNWDVFIKQQGGSLLTPDFQHSALESPQVQAGTLQLRSLITQYRVAPNPADLDSWMGFRQGKVSMVMEGIYMLADLRKSEGLDYGGSAVPLFGNERATWGGSHMLCMPARTSASKARSAWRLAKYLSDHSLDWADGGQVPVRNSLRESARFRAMTVQSAFASQLPYVKYDPPSVKQTEMGPFVDAAVEAALLGIEPPEKAMTDCAARVDRVLERP